MCTPSFKVRNRKVCTLLYEEGDTRLKYGEICIGTDFRLRKYPEQRQVAQGLRKKKVICSKNLKEIENTPEKCPVRILVGLNYDSRMPFTTQWITEERMYNGEVHVVESKRVDHWCYVREVIEDSAE